MRRVLRTLLFILLLVGVLVVAAVAYVVHHTAPLRHTEQNVPNAQVALVLGASVSSKGVLSSVLAERADAAVRLYKQHKVERILVTGDNSTLQYDEVYPIGKYLLAHDIPQKDIFLDYAGFDTYSSLYRAKEVFGVQSMIITTQYFHLPRALYLAEHFGITAYGVDVAETSDNYTLNALREIPATLKMLFDIELLRKPKYLGQSFPIVGDGTATWVGGAVELIYFKDDSTN